MDDDQPLRSLGGVAAEQDSASRVDDATWERLAIGELTVEEVTDLERRAADDEEIAMLLSAYRPIDAMSRERMAASVVERTRPAADRATKEPMPGRWRVRVYAGSAALALAAAVALFVSRGGTSEPLPLYAIDVSEAATMRGPSGDPPAPNVRGCSLRASRRGSFEVIARSDQPAYAPITAVAFLVRDDGLEPWQSGLEVSPAGSVRIADASERLRGSSELRVVVARKELFTPADALDKARRAVPSGAGWQVLRCTITAAAD